MVYNLFKRHSSTLVLIHRPDSDLEGDPYDSHEADVLKTRAIDSSIWELSSLTSHYHSAVATLARIFKEKLAKPSYELEDFADHTYNTVSLALVLVWPDTRSRSSSSENLMMQLFETEMKRVVKNAPALDLPPAQAKKAEFFPVEAPSFEWTDPITELWTFKGAAES